MVFQLRVVAGTANCSSTTAFGFTMLFPIRRPRLNRSVLLAAVKGQLVAVGVANGRRRGQIFTRDING
jgi:hypothetical protein